MKKISVVIIEDDHMMIDLLTDYLKDNNYIEVIGIAQNGEDGIKLVSSLMPDLVLLDLIVPNMDGFEIMEKVKRLYIRSKFLVISSLSDDYFIKKSLSYGASYYLIKPFSSTLLKERIMDLCSSKSDKKDVYQYKNTITNEKIETIVEEAPSGGNKNKLFNDISNILISVGVPANIIGYKFLREAIFIAVQNPDKVSTITKTIYVEVADKYETTKGSVERAIRHAIEVAWNRGRLENINSVFGVHIYGKSDKPTNGEFIALVTDKILTTTI